MSFESCIEASEHLGHSSLQWQLTIQYLTRPAGLCSEMLCKSLLRLSFSFMALLWNSSQIAKLSEDNASDDRPQQKCKTCFLFFVIIDPNTCRLLIVPPCEGFESITTAGFLTLCHRILIFRLVYSPLILIFPPPLPHGCIPHIVAFRCRQTVSHQKEGFWAFQLWVLIVVVFEGLHPIGSVCLKTWINQSAG